jgi:hypothetical protein
MNKTRVVTSALLFLLSLSLFTTLSIKPVEAIVPNHDAIALKEYKQWSSWNPSYTFSKSEGFLQMMSTQSGLGDAYAFFHIDKNQLQGNKLRIYWRWYLDYSDTSYTLANVYIVDNVANRKLENQGEFSTYNDVEHPVADFTYTTACSLSATCNGEWIDWTTSESNILDLSGYGSTLTIMIKSVDLWIANTVGLQVDYLQILNSNNQVLKTYDFSSSVYMDRTGGYYDYGTLRNPTSITYGTTNYAEYTGAPEGELETSEAINDAICDLFSNRGYYVGNYWGPNTTQYYVNSLTYNCERYYDYSMVLYKGHTWPLDSWCNHDPGCSLFHNSVYDYVGTDDDYCIRDYEIDDQVIAGKNAANKFATHDFIFMWTCGLANTSASSVGVYNDAHSSSFLPSWMHINPWSLNTDGYHGTPDYSDHVFIGFEWQSKSYLDTTGMGSYNYGHWIWYFYYYLLDQGYTVKDALDQATRDTHYAYYYDNCPLDDWYQIINPITQQLEWSRMRIWGDSSTMLPR